SPTPDSVAEKGPILEVDLGRTPTAHVRWQARTGPPSEAALFVREGYLWDIRPSSSTLSAVLQYTHAKGSFSKLTLHIPEELAVLNIGVSRLPGDLAEGTSPRLQDWNVTGTGKERHLELEFYRPVSGGVQVMLELVPDHILAGTVVLPFPHPMNARAAEGVGKESLLAYRITGLKSQVDGNQRLTGIEDLPFTEFWRAARMGDPGRDLHAYRISHTPGGTPFVRLKLQPLPDTVQGTQNLTWTVGRHRADFRLIAKLTSPEETLVLAEWEIPRGITLGEVSGAEVRNWSLSENRLQVWLQKPVKTARIQCTGWTTVEESKPPQNPLSSKEAAAIRFNLRPIRLIASPPATTYVQITGVGDLKLKPVNIRHLLPLPDIGKEFENLEFVNDNDDYTGTFVARKESTSFPARLLTLVEVIDRKLTFQTFIEGTIPQGAGRTLTIYLRNWESEDVRLEAPGATWRHEASSGLKEQTFLLSIPQEKAPVYQWKITGRRPLKPGTESRFPDITVDGGRYQERWLAISGKDLRGEDPRGLKPLGNPLPVLAAWPAEAEKIRRSGSAWQVLSPDWHMRLTPFPAAENSAPIQVILADQTAAVVDGRHWVHQVTYWLMYEAGLDLHLTLPANARVFAATLDGTDVSPLQPEANRLWLPLAGAAGTHLLRLKWIVEEDPTQLLRPRLESLKIEGIPDPPTLWTIYVPAGYEVYSPLAASGTVSPAEHDWHRAEAQLQLSAILGERTGGGAGDSFKAQLLTTQERFYRFIRTARHRSVGNPGLDARCKELKERNVKLAASLDFDPIRVQAERQVLQHPGVPEPGFGTSPAGNDRTSAVRESALQPLGMPMYWFSPAQGPGPTVHLIAKAEENRNRALLSSGLLVAFLVSIWLLSFSPRMVSLFPETWPEQLLLLAILGWVWLGSNWISLFLGAVGVIGRLVIAGGWIWNMLDQRKTEEAG
ncbi:MAG TPA: hypothetical protein VGY77_10890, partial [Gemmataceae bacterium]|nr:hypothetical protein [Gemmataceae bacterium]